MTTLAIILTIVLATGTYGIVAAFRWHERSSDWEQQSRTLGTEVATLRRDLASTVEQLDQTDAELSTAQKRITELANEKAQLGDENQAARMYISYQKEVAAAANTVAKSLNKCTTAQSTLMGYLQNKSHYDAASIDKVSQEVNALCKEATDANDKLQAILQQ